MIAALRFVLSFLVFLEIFFHLGSWINHSAHNYFNQSRSTEQGVYRIMCIGESTTIGGGSDSYPSQLERMLNGQPGRGVQVINQGLPGVDTTLIAEHLPQWIETYHPDMVIAMIGALDPSKKADHPGISAFLKKIKTYQVFRQLKAKTAVAFKDLARQYKLMPPQPPPKAPEPYKEDYILFQEELAKAPQIQKQLYAFIQLSMANGQIDSAQNMYESLLNQGLNDFMRLWVIKQYADFLLTAGRYEKFVSIMDQVPYIAWTARWVKPYCQSEEHMERIKKIVEEMVDKKGVDPMAYGYAAACYEEGGKEDLAKIYKERLKVSSYANPVTRRNYIAIKNLLLSKNIKPVFVQYPMRDVSMLKNVFSGELDADRVLFVDNGPSFQKAVGEISYGTYFLDRAIGSAGHGTREGNRLLASNVADVIRKEINR